MADSRQFGQEDNSDSDSDSEYEEVVDYRKTPGFWVFHPFARGIATSLLCGVCSSVVSFEAGFLYGALSGVFNIATRAVTGSLRQTEFTPEVRALVYLAVVTVPWIASTLTMRQMLKFEHKPLFSPIRPLFHITNAAAIGTALAVEFWGSANLDLLASHHKPKK